MGETPNHTFAILAYKQSPYLQLCIESLFKQSRPSSILLVTSTPSPFLEQIAARCKIPLIVNEARRGMSWDWSYAYQAARTKYVTLAHQDDLYQPHYTEASVAAAERSRDAIITFSDYAEMMNGKRRDWSLNLAVKRLLLAAGFLGKERLASRWSRKLLLSFADPISCPSVMYNKERIGEFRFSDQYACNMDWDAWLRLAELEGSFIYLNKALLVHRLHPDSETSLHISNRARALEERMILNRTWPRPISDLLFHLYSLGHLSNKCEPIDSGAANAS